MSGKTMRNIVHVTFLSLTVALTGCPKKGPSVEELSNNPRVNFQDGVDILSKPDRKTGAIDYALAYERFNKAANLGAGAKAEFNAGWVAEQLGRPDEAANHYRKAWEAEPTYEAAMFSLARVLTTQGKSAEAIELYRNVVEKDPNNIEARNDLVSALVAGQQYDAALAEAQEILRKKPDDASVYRNLSALYYAQQNYSLSQLSAEKALQLNDGDPGVYNNMGVTYLIQGDEAAAIEKFRTAIKLQSDNYEANMNLGFVALNSGDYALAKTCFSAASGTNPGSLDAKLGLAVSHRGLKEYKEAQALYDQIISADRQFDAAYFNAARLNSRYVKDFDKALKYLQDFVNSKAGTLSPNHDVFVEMKKIQDLQAEEAERKRIEAEKKKAEEERQKRNAELLSKMAATITSTQAKIEANRGCLDEGSVEEVGMILEQAQMVVDAKDTDMAADIQQLLDAYVPAVDDAVANCAGGGAAPAPAPEDEPTEGEEAPPAEETPE